jgi:hypothetical protein
MIKRYLAVACCLLFILGCKTEIKVDEGEEKQQAEKVLHTFFNAIADYNYGTLREQTMPDFRLIEHGLFWNADSLIDSMRGYETTARLAYKLDISETVVQGPVAWINYRNQGSVFAENKEQRVYWVETAILKKTATGWKMALLHSTLIKTE